MIKDFSVLEVLDENWNKLLHKESFFKMPKFPIFLFMIFRSVVSFGQSVSLDPILSEKLTKIYQDDQEIRERYMDSVKLRGNKFASAEKMQWEMRYTDSLNLKKVVGILNTQGWPGPDRVGKSANQAVFLVIQHADLKTQQKYLPLMREAVVRGNAARDDLALLEDRVAIREGRKQIFGTQIGTNPKNNEVYVLPLTDPDHVDQRRIKMGLGSMTEYLKNWNKPWDIKEYKRNLSLYEEWTKGHY